MKNIIKSVIIAFGVGLILYSVICCLRLNFNLSNIFPAIIGTYFILASFFYKHFLPGSTAGFRRVFNTTIVAGSIFFVTSFALMCSAIFINSKNVPEPGHEAVIVLGCGLYGGDRVSSTLALRLDKGISYLNDNPDAVCVVSGGQGADEDLPEAHAMRDYLLAMDVDPHRIIIEDKSTSTEENFLFSKEILDEMYGIDNYSIVHVTNDFHSLRAGFYAKDAGLDAEGLSSKTPLKMLPNYYTREYFAMLWYFVFDSWG